MGAGLRRGPAEDLAPATPEHVASSQSSTVEAADGDEVVVLESSPGRPGTSQAVRVAAGSVKRLSSFYFRGAPLRTAAAAEDDDDGEAGGQRTPVSEAAGDLQHMGISPARPQPADFGDIIGRFRWQEDADNGSGAAAPAAAAAAPAARKRALPPASPDRRGRRLMGGDAPRRGRGRLLRGSRAGSRVALSSAASTSASASPEPPAADAQLPRAKRSAVVVSSSSDSDEGSAAEDEGGAFRRTFEDIEPHVMALFGRGTCAELMDKAGATEAEARAIVGLRPFADMEAVEQALRRARGVRLAVFSQFRDTLLGHMEVEAVIAQCAGIFAQLQRALERAGIRTRQDRAIEVAAEAMRQPRMVSAQYRLKHYQLEGVEWLTCLRNAGASGILADEMGLGKTFQVIAFLCRALEEPGARARGPSLVVCPSSTLDNWMNECAKFAPGLRAVAYCGSQAERLALQEQLQDEAAYDVLVTTYTLATGNKLDRVFLRKRGFQAMILDEGHMVKNCMSSRYKWLTQVRAPFRLLLTGTPLQNNLQELVSLLTFILPQVFAESQPALSHAFKTKGRRALPESDDNNNSSNTPAGTEPPTPGAQTPSATSAVSPVEAQHIEQAKKLLRPFVLRRRKCDVLGDLPSKTEHVDRVELGPAQRALYDSVAPEIPLDLGSLPGESLLAAADEPAQKQQQQQQQQQQQGRQRPPHHQPTGSSWISTFMDMRKAADHPLLLRSHYDADTINKMARQLLREPDYADAQYQYVVEDMLVCSDFELHRICTKYAGMRRFALRDEQLLAAAKIARLREIVDEARARGEKLLLFSQFTSMLDILEHVLAVWGVAFARLDGQTKVDERQAMIDEFNASAVPVFLLSTKAGGFGINLTSANVVVIYDSGNNPSEERQAEDRAHRVGQTKDVRVYRLVAANTIDEDILESSRSKLVVEQMFWF